MADINENRRQPLISILIPLYNHAAYIAECLDSILEQGPERIELILIDDGSSDDGLVIAQRWKELHGDGFALIEFNRQENAGITRTFDRLIRRSTGDVIMIVASDDMLLPGSISSRLELLQQPGVMAVFGDALPVDGSGKAIGTSAIGELGNPSSRSALADPRTLPWELIFRWNIYGSVLMCRREAILKSDGSTVLNLDIFCEDMQLYYQLSSHGTLRYLDQPVAKYRIHGANTSHSEENIGKLRTSGYQARKHAMKEMPWGRRTVVAMQAFTHHRWAKGLRARALFPFVAAAYAGALSARFIYDLYRVYVLHQPQKI